MLAMDINFTLSTIYKSASPSFFDLCNYQGYGDAIKSGNFTEYYMKTTFGKFGNINNCFNKHELDSLLYPSGDHSKYDIVCRNNLFKFNDVNV